MNAFPQKCCERLHSPIRIHTHIHSHEGTPFFRPCFLLAPSAGGSPSFLFLFFSSLSVDLPSQPRHLQLCPIFGCFSRQSKFSRRAYAGAFPSRLSGAVLDTALHPGLCALINHSHHPRSSFYPFAILGYYSPFYAFRLSSIRHPREEVGKGGKI